MTDQPLPPEFIPTERFVTYSVEAESDPPPFPTERDRSPWEDPAPPVMTFDASRRTNARAVVDAVKLGFLRGTVLDLTVGPKAGFWTDYQPTDLTTNDLDPTVPASMHLDALDTMLPGGRYDDVVLDIDYGYRGSSKGTEKNTRSTSLQEMDHRFGTSEYRGPKAVDLKLADTTREACRIAAHGALVKCQDACVGSTFHHQTRIVIDAARHAGFKPVGMLHVVGGVPQPKGKTQLNVWTNYSTLVLLRRRKKLRQGG